MLNAVLLLACCSALASANPTITADQLEHSSFANADLPERSPEIKDSIKMIHAILEKLFVRSKTSPEYHASDSPKRVIVEVRKFGRSNALPWLV